MNELKMWSDLDGAVVSWAVVHREENDSGGNPHSVIAAERVVDGHVVETLRFSPNCTDQELKEYVRDVNRRHTHDRNAPEVEDD